jgi:hypothetical protein
MRDSQHGAPRLERAWKAMALAAIPVLVFTILFKFAPDLATASVQGRASLLTGFEAFRSELVGIHATRFAGNEIVFHLARGLAAIVGVSSDVRMHPLRMAAAVTTCVYIGLIVLPVMSERRRHVWHWSTFCIAFLPMAALSLQIYKPYDLPALLFVALGFLAVVEDKFGLAILCVVICGLFRESGLHVVWFAVCMAVLRGGRHRDVMAVTMVATWAVELSIVRWFYGFKDHLAPPPHDLLSPSLWLTLSAIGLFCAAAALDLRARETRMQTPGERVMFRFLGVQLAAVPVWLAIYHLEGGGLAEFRMLLPVVLPLAFSLAWQGSDPAYIHSGPSRSAFRFTSE